jgi:pilus assembly protein Flp/PilA
MKKLLFRLIYRVDGANMVEYGLLLVLVALAAAAGLSLLGTNLGAFFTSIAGKVSGATVPSIP